MNRKIWKQLIAVSLFTAIAMVGVQAVGQSKPPSQSPQSVLVVNGSGQPVPTAAQGTTNVAGTVNVGNTPNVNVANTPSVNVANTPTVSLAGGASVSVTNPLDGQSNPTPLAVLEAMQPYEDNCVISFSGNGFAHCDLSALPSGKRLVLQVFEALGEVETGLKPIEILLSLNTVHTFTATFMGGTGSDDFFATHQETHLYLSSGTPTCYAGLTNVSFSGSFKCVLSGFLVDVPQ
jgi:hypothetical protein